MTYDRYRPLRQQLKVGTQLAQGIPDLLPRMNSVTRMQQTVPTNWSSAPPTRLVRDPLYRVERRIYSWFSDVMPWFHSLPDAEAYVRSVLVNYREAFSRVDWPLSFVETTESGAWYWAGVMTIPIPVQKMALLHETSHHLVGNDAGHGPDFFNVYMTLLRAEMGNDIADRFIAEMNPE